MVRSEIREAIEESFTKENLSAGYLPYITKVYFNSSDLLTDAGYQGIMLKKSKNKADLVTLLAPIFSDRKLFMEFLSLIPDEARKLFNVLMWEDSFVHEKNIRSEYGIDVSDRLRNAGWKGEGELKKEFFLFSYRRVYNWNEGYQYLVGIPHSLKKELLGYFDKPEGFYLQPAGEIPENLYQFQGEEIIFEELPRLLVYANQDNIKLTTSGIPVASTYSKMRKALAVKEYYEGLPKPFDSLRTSLIATLLAQAGKQSATQDNLKSLKQLFTFFAEKFYPFNLLQHLKGLGYVSDHHKFKLGKSFVDILQEFPGEEWVSMDNINKFAAYRSLHLKPAEDYFLSRHTYFPVEKRGYTQKEQIDSSNYKRLIQKPLLQAGFFLFAALGIVDAAYENPEESVGNEEEPYFHTLRYVRLTPLGAYLCGRSKEYVPPKTEEKAGIQLLDDSLNILSDKPSQTVDLLLENYTIKVGSSRYKTDFGIFMKGVRNADDLESKINLFRQTVTNRLPQNWENFFNTLTLKCDPLKSIGPHMAYQLSKEDQELIQLVAKDPVLKKLAIKAEGLIILVMKADQAKFKNRLKEFGYLLE